MPRLKVNEAPQHGVADSMKDPPSVGKGLGKKRRSGNSPAVEKKPRVFLSKDDQSLIILRYMELPKDKKVVIHTGEAPNVLPLVLFPA